MYDDFDHLRTLFQESLVMYKGRPVFIMKIEEEHSRNFFGIDIKSRDLIHGSVNDPSLNVSGLKLGNVNLPTEVVLLTRRPGRQYSQGLNDRNTIIQYFGPRDFSLMLSSPEISDTVMGLFPSVGEAVEKLQEGRHSIAVSRNLFITNNLRVYSGDVHIGGIVNKEFKPKKGKEFFRHCFKGVL